MSDRSICYMATGKPAVVQHTGPSRLLPDSMGSSGSAASTAPFVR
jgi:hypothetical protein